MFWRRFGRRPSVERVIITSSQFVCAPGRLPENDTDYFPETVYGQSKVVTEKLTREANLPCCWTIIRPTNIWGPWHMRYRREFWRVVERGLYVHPGREPVIRCYGYVKNVAHQIRKIFEADVDLVRGQTFYLGDRPTNLYDWTNGFSRALRGRDVLVVPRPLMRTLALLGDIPSSLMGKSFLINSSRFRSMTTDYQTPMERTFELVRRKSLYAGGWNRRDSQLAQILPGRQRFRRRFLMHAVVNLILSHQSASAVAKMLDHWKGSVPGASIVVAYGGTKSGFEAVEHEGKFFVDDPRLRTRDHQRELQSYTRLFQSAAEFLKARGSDFHFVHFAEYDHLPLVENLNERQIERLNAERADLLAFHVHRVDDTNNPHFLYHAADERFMKHWADITRRAEPEVVLSMFGSGSFWTREAFLAMCAVDEPFPIYMELYLPTLVHHLGFRVRDFGDQNRFVRVLKDETDYVDQARKEGAWTLHPVKRLWDK